MDTHNYEAASRPEPANGRSTIMENNAVASDLDDNAPADALTLKKDASACDRRRDSIDSMFDSSRNSTPASTPKSTTKRDDATSADSNAPSLDALLTRAESSPSKLENENNNNTSPPLNEGESHLAESSSEIKKKIDMLQ